MKVLLAHFDSLATLHGGVEWYVHLLAGALAEEGHDVRVVTRRGRAAPPPGPAYEWVRLPALPASHRTRLLLERWYARGVRKAAAWADVVHSQNVDGAGALGVKPVVATVHTTPLDEWPSSRLGGWREALYQRRLHETTARRWRAVVPRLRHVWATGPHVAESLRQLGAARVEVMPNPVPPIPRVPQADARARLRLPDGPLVLYLGRLARVKRPDRVIAALPPGARLVIAGEGPEDAMLRKLADGRVTFLGRVDDATKALLYNAADVLVLPSEHEGQPLVLLEAMSAGLPIVATRAEWVPPGLQRFGLFGDDYASLVEKALRQGRHEGAPVLGYREAAKRFSRTYEEVAR